MSAEGVAIEMCRDGESSVAVTIEDDGSVRLTAARIIQYAPPQFRWLSTSDLAPDDAQRIGEALIRAAGRARGEVSRPLTVILGDEFATDSPRARRERAAASIAKALEKVKP